MTTPTRAYWITGVHDCQGLARRLRRQGYAVAVQGRDCPIGLYIVGEHRPWAELAGYATRLVSIREIPLEAVPQRLRNKIPMG